MLDLMDLIGKGVAKQENVHILVAKKNKNNVYIIVGQGSGGLKSPRMAG